MTILRPVACCIVLATLCFVVCIPDPALAWGPGAHIAMSNWLLANSALLPPELVGPLTQFPGQFIHGALSPDIFIGKGSKALEGHSHNWESGLLLLNKNRSPRWLAYAYGYLAHFAADTVAHNVFVPGAFSTAPGTGKLAHVYLEAQADRLLAWQSQQAVQAFTEDGSRRADAVLRASLSRNTAFWLRKSMFQHSISMVDSTLWRNSMKWLDRLFSSEELEAFLDRMLHFSLRAVLSLLRDTENSPVRQLDPIGADALNAAMRSGKSLLPGTLVNRLLPPFAMIDSGLVAPDHSLVTFPVPDILLTLPEETIPASLLHLPHSG